MSIPIRKGAKKAAALRYDLTVSQAPQVVAKGSNRVAEQIVDTAGECGIPIVEDPDLTELLYPLQMGECIPEVLYKPIAKILSFVFVYRERKTPFVNKPK